MTADLAHRRLIWTATLGRLAAHSPRDTRSVSVSRRLIYLDSLALRMMRIAPARSPLAHCLPPSYRYFFRGGKANARRSGAELLPRRPSMFWAGLLVGGDGWARRPSPARLRLHRDHRDIGAIFRVQLPHDVAHVDFHCA